MDIVSAKKHIDTVIDKARVHLYKPIQIAEILHRSRIHNDIVLSDLQTYRTTSKKWRDIVCIRFLGRTSTSSARYQDDLFNKSAVPPEAIDALGQENSAKNGIVEAYIYNRFKERYEQMTGALTYSREATPETFDLEEFLQLFWNEPGLRRSIDKIYEIVVYSLFSVLVDELGINITVSIDDSKMDILREFEDFAKKVICIDASSNEFSSPASINRVGVTNAADRGLDMWANFGPAIQVKHLSLNEGLAEEIVGTVSSDRIVIVCKDTDHNVITSLLSQIGWRSKIQSIVMVSELISWYEKALRGEFSSQIGEKLLDAIRDEIMLEFPTSDGTDFFEFYNGRGYDKLSDDFWN